MFFSPHLSCRVVNALPAASYGTGATLGVAFDRRNFRNALVILQLGVLGAAATIDAKTQHSNVLASGDADWGDWTGAAFGQKTKAAHDALVFVAELKDLQPMKKYLRPHLTVGAAASLLSMAYVLMNPDRDIAVDKPQGASEAKAAPIGTSLGAGNGYEFIV